MRNVCFVLLAAALAFGCVQAVGAQESTVKVMVANYVPPARAATALQVPSAVNPLTYIGFRAGAMVSPRGAGLLGLDFTVPNVVGLGTGARTRIDADAIINGNFGGINTVFPVTVNQLYSSPIS